jgi:hypothetical protein
LSFLAEAFNLFKSIEHCDGEYGTVRNWEFVSVSVDESGGGDDALRRTKAVPRGTADSVRRAI